MNVASSPGVSGISLYVPRLRVPLDAWCEWTGASAPKVQAVVGRSFRMCAPHESIYTMAANAVLRLIDAYAIDPRRVGFLGFGTESSTDNAAGAIIIKGMVDRALEATGRPPLARNCEVPEFKHACLGGVYALKNATRYLSCDGKDRIAIVVSGDIAEYERGSTGEQTQGAGAVAMFLENRPAMFALDLAQSGSAAAYRGVDFRKPFARHFADGYCEGVERMHDFPVFNGKYSTLSYVDEVIAALEDLFSKRVGPRQKLFDEVEAVLMHRPYHHMPIQALASALVWTLGRDADSRPQLKALCESTGASFDRVMEQVLATPDLLALVESQGAGVDPTPDTNAVVKAFRGSDTFKTFVKTKLSLGSELVKDLGNLYTAALPAWIAAAFEDAQMNDRALAGKRLLTIGYGSGDAAEAIPLEVADAWREAAAKIGFREALANPVDLTREQYEALHDGREVEGLQLQPRGEFVVERVGNTNTPDFQDVGIEYYRYVPAT